MVRKFLDMSTWQKSVDYATAASGLDGVILRAGYGKGTEDILFKKHYDGFHNLGIPIGVYWFSYAKSVEESKSEAQYCVSAIHGLTIELPVVYDFEYASVRNANTTGIKIDKPLATAMAEAFLSIIEQNGYYAMLYTSPDFKRNYFDDSLNKYDLWLANYVKNPDPNKPPCECGIWQHGSGKWNGVEGDVDLNFAYKDYPSIIRKAGLNHLEGTHPITHDQLVMNWAYENNYIVKDEIDAPATKGDIVRLLYEYHMRSTGEDSRTRSGVLGG